jgi:hypothetical protein
MHRREMIRPKVNDQLACILQLRNAFVFWVVDEIDDPVKVSLPHLQLHDFDEMKSVVVVD